MQDVDVSHQESNAKHSTCVSLRHDTSTTLEIPPAQLRLPARNGYIQRAACALCSSHNRVGFFKVGGRAQREFRWRTRACDITM